MKNKFLLLGITFFPVFAAVGQIKDFSFRRKISPVDSAGWYSINLPDDIYKNLNRQFSDLRIYQFNEKDTVESPYVLKIHEQQITEETIPLSVLNQSKKSGKQFFTFELPHQFQVNYLELSFSEINFDGLAMLEGSNDQKEWFEIEKNQRIISIQNQNVQFVSAALHFKPQTFQFLRLQLKADKPLTLEKASFKKQLVQPGVLNDLKLSWKETQDKKAKQSVIAIEMKDYQPVVRLEVATNEPNDYYRSFRLERLSDSSMTPKGWQYFYGLVSQGYLTSLDSNIFNFDFIAAKKFRLIIDHADNAPLKIKSISLARPKIELFARLVSSSTYLYYGNSQANAPSYDLVHFKDKLPSSLPSLTISAEEKLVAAKEKISPLIENKIWLWTVMAVVIAVLGFFTLRMMKAK